MSEACRHHRMRVLWDEEEEEEGGSLWRREASLTRPFTLDLTLQTSSSDSNIKTIQYICYEWPDCTAQAGCTLRQFEITDRQKQRHRPYRTKKNWWHVLKLLKSYCQRKQWHPVLAELCAHWRKQPNQAKYRESYTSILTARERHSAT